MSDLHYMKVALGQAKRGLGRTWPNPTVGCVLVKDGRIVGLGHTQPGGRPHAEVVALTQAGPAAQGATAYVTLEPCAHHGQTPPCAEALVAAQVARVVIALVDPDPRVGGRGIEILEAAGIDLSIGLCNEEAAAINAGFLKRVNYGQPLVTLKVAASLDGRIATHSGHSQWITGPQARTMGHLMRAQHDAIMVGSGTVIADDPSLTCRLPGLGHTSPVRVIADGRLRTPLTSTLVATAKQVPTWLITGPDADPTRREAFEQVGVEVLLVDWDDHEALDMTQALTALGDRGITRLLVEGGSHLSSALIRDGLVDQIAWFHAPKIVGGDGLPALQAFGIDTLDQAVQLKSIATEQLGGDILETYKIVEADQ